MGLVVTLDEGRSACSASVHAFRRAVDGLREYELLGQSRCHGWTRLDVTVHVIAGWQEMLGGFVSAVDSEPTVDAASYWTAFASEYATEDPIPTLMSQRRRTAAYARPASATPQLRDVAEALFRGVEAAYDTSYLWQGHVFAPGDFLAVWAVENVIHHLDLMGEEPALSSATDLACATVEALLGEQLPGQWSDEEAVLIGTGRLPVPDGSPELAGRLPALA